MDTIENLAAKVRSKNAEPFLTTIDVFFDDEAAYEAVKSRGRLTEERVAECYGVPESAVYGVYFVDNILVAKVTVFKYDDGRFISQGDPAGTDMYGCQGYVPLLDLEV